MWMSHPDVSGVVTVADSAFFAGWDTLGWVADVAPEGPPQPDAGWPVSEGEVLTLVGQEVAAQLPAAAAAAIVADQPRQNATYAAKAKLDLSVWDFGVVGDGVALDGVKMQAFITACGPGNKVKLTQGTFGQKWFNCSDTPLVMLPFQTLEGTSKQLGSGPNGFMELRFPDFTGAEVGITFDSSSTARDILVRGPGTGVGTCVGIKSDTVSTRFKGVQVFSWATGMRCINNYYSTFDDCEWNRCKVGLALTGCTNTTINVPRFDSKSDDGLTYGTAIDTGQSLLGLQIFGGAIESYGPIATPGIKVGTFCTVGLFGVYWESPCPSAMGISGGAGDCSFTVKNNYVNLSEHNNWLYTGAGVNTSVTGSGNRFSCKVDSSTAPVAYYGGNAQDYTLASDHWSLVLKAGAAYVAGAMLYGPNSSISPPLTASGAGLTFQGKRIIEPTISTNVAVSGAVVIDAAKGHASFLLQATANVTASSIINAADKQVMSITVRQDGTGGHTFAWPPTCKFAGGAPPSDTTASKRTTVTFASDSVFNWYEISRSVAVG